MKLKITLIILILTSSYFATAQGLNVQESHYTGKPIIKMLINNKKTWVLLDTGSEITIVDSQAKDDFGFKTHVASGSRYKVPGLGSSNNQLEHTSKVDILFGEVKLKGHVYAFDMSNIVSSIYHRTGHKITAIIGTKMMKYHGFIIDMGNNKVSMYYKDEKGKKLAKNKTLLAGINSNGYIK